MGIKQDVKNNHKAYPVTKINGQPTAADINKLKNQISEMVASITTTNGEGMHGHTRMITKDAIY